MSNSPFKRIFLPSILVSTAVFSALTLTFVLRKPEAIRTELRPSEPRLAQLLTDEYKGSVIRYVGFTIIASVGSGVITAEALRKWQSLRESMQVKKPQLNLVKLLPQKEPQVELSNLEVELSNLEVDQEIAATNQILELESIDHSLSLEPDLDTSAWALIEAQKLTDDDDEIEPDDSSYVQPLGQALITESDWFSPLQHCESGWLDTSTQVICAPLRIQTTATDPILELNQQYQTCRVRIPFLEGSRFAVLFNGQYYSFSRLENNREQAFAAAQKLVQRDSHVAITQVKNGYAVWTLEPDAFQN